MSKVRGPVVALLYRKVQENHRLRDELRGVRDDLASERLRLLGAEARLAIVRQERDRLRRDVWAQERQIRLLMEATPTDLREMEA